MITFSVIVPCYNSEATVITCVRSIFSQTRLPQEIIVIDDGSKDNTPALLEVLKAECPLGINFCIILQKNSGPSVARNCGIKKATSSWIAFLDSDDYWESNNLSVMNSFIETFNECVLFGGSGQLQHLSFNTLLYRNYFQTSTTVVKKNIILNHLFNEKQRYSEDYRAWLNISYENQVTLVPGYQAFPVIERNDPFSGNGLSSKLLKMEFGELNNFFSLFKENKITFFKFVVISIYSFLKYLRRCLKLGKIS